MSRIPHFVDNRLTDSGEVSALCSDRSLPPRIILILLLEVASTLWNSAAGSALRKLKIPVTSPWNSLTSGTVAGQISLQHVPNLHRWALHIHDRLFASFPFLLLKIILINSFCNFHVCHSIYIVFI
jgi:hypothetical protein